MVADESRGDYFSCFYRRILSSRHWRNADLVAVTYIIASFGEFGNIVNRPTSLIYIIIFFKLFNDAENNWAHKTCIDFSLDIDGQE
jgi:hypothetical protein